MEEATIRKRMELEIDNWMSGQYKEGFHDSISISEEAKNFVVEMIQNIVKDPSEYWKLDPKEGQFQELAIARIPDALDQIIRFNKRHRRINTYEPRIQISSWEIWYALSQILIKFCFIPEKDMR